MGRPRQVWRPVTVWVVDAQPVGQAVGHVEKRVTVGVCGHSRRWAGTVTLMMLMHLSWVHGLTGSKMQRWPSMVLVAV